MPANTARSGWLSTSGLRVLATVALDCSNTLGAAQTHRHAGHGFQKRLHHAPRQAAVDRQVGDQSHQLRSEAPLRLFRRRCARALPAGGADHLGTLILDDIMRLLFFAARVAATFPPIRRRMCFGRVSRILLTRRQLPFQICDNASRRRQSSDNRSATCSSSLSISCCCRSTCRCSASFPEWSTCLRGSITSSCIQAAISQRPKSIGITRRNPYCRYESVDSATPSTL
jgi:hypothetical protein